MTTARARVPVWLGVHEPARLQLCPCVENYHVNSLGLRLCAPGAVPASAVHLARVPHVLALALRAALVSDGSSCAACAAAAADWAALGRLAVRANVLTNVEQATGTGTRCTLARTNAGAGSVTCTPQGAARVCWGPGVAGVVELAAVVWCGTPVPLPAFPLLWDDVAVMCQMGLRAVASEHRTPALCLVAVRHDQWNLQHVPQQHCTPAMCAGTNGYLLHAVPAALCTPEMCLAAVQKVGWAIDDVPLALRTPELCLAAVQFQGTVLARVPDACLTPALCAAAVQQDGRALRYVPHVLRTPDLCETAIRENWGAIDFVPSELRSSELTALAEQQRERQRDVGLVDFGDIAWCTPAQVEAAVRRNGDALGGVPPAQRTPELCALAVLRSSGQAACLFEVPEALRTPELCAAAVQHNGMNLRFVPPALRTPELCMAAVRQNNRALGHVCLALCTVDLCTAALQVPPFFHDTASDIPPEHLTPALLWAGLEAAVSRCVRPQWAVHGFQKATW